MTKTVLLCDDEICILRAIEFKLKRSGFDVVLAADGQEAWEMIQTNPPDLVVTDCQMPRLDGLGLVRRVRNDPRFSHLPMIMVTAKSYELDRARLEQDWNLAAIIEKPFSPRHVAIAVQQVLETGTCQRQAMSVS